MSYAELKIIALNFPPSARKFSECGKNLQKASFRSTSLIEKVSELPKLLDYDRNITPTRNMFDAGKVREDLEVLESMFPEIIFNHEVSKITEQSSFISGHIDFDMHFSTKILEVHFENQTISLSKFLGNKLKFKIDLPKYPSFENSITLSLQSNYFSEVDTERILKSLHEEYDEMTNPASENYEPDTPILMLVFNSLMYDSLDRLFSEESITCESKEQFEVYKSASYALSSDISNRTNYDCSICIESKKGIDMIQLPCNGGHRLCQPCLKEYYTKMINEGQISFIRCPECDYKELNLNDYTEYKQLINDLFTPKIPFSFFHGFLSNETCEKYEKLFHSQMATLLSKHSPYSCVICRKCDSWCVKTNLDEQMIRCTNCESTFCFDCLHSWHGYNNKCGAKVTLPRAIVEEYIDVMETDLDRKRKIESVYGKKVLELEVSDYMAEKMLDIAIAAEDSDLQRCPKCKVVVQRSEGCNRMKCMICTTYFCYLCGDNLPMESGYEHFKEKYSPCYGRLFEGMPGIDDE